MIILTYKKRNVKRNRKERDFLNTEGFDELVRKEKLEYFRQWRAKNKDKVRQHNQNYWQRRAEKRLKEKEQAGNE